MDDFTPVVLDESDEPGGCLLAVILLCLVVIVFGTGALLVWSLNP